VRHICLLCKQLRARAHSVLAIAPLSEEIFFRAWLLVTLRRAGASFPARVALSSILFSLWHVPLGRPEMAPTDLLAFGALGAVLAAMYDASSGSLPLVASTHASYNLIVTLLRYGRYVDGL
jgi:membrane protease YdiL (CAAX protease family)